MVVVTPLQKAVYPLLFIVIFNVLRGYYAAFCTGQYFYYFIVRRYPLFVLPLLALITTVSAIVLSWWTNTNYYVVFLLATFVLALLSAWYDVALMIWERFYSDSLYVAFVFEILAMAWELGVMGYLCYNFWLTCQLLGKGRGDAFRQKMPSPPCTLWHSWLVLSGTLFFFCLRTDLFYFRDDPYIIKSASFPVLKWFEVAAALLWVVFMVLTRKAPSRATRRLSMCTALLLELTLVVLSVWFAVAVSRKQIALNDSESAGYLDGRWWISGVYFLITGLLLLCGAAGAALLGELRRAEDLPEPEQGSPEPWQTELCQCGQLPLADCFLGCFCPCVMFGKIRALVNGEAETLANLPCLAYFCAMMFSASCLLGCVGRMDIRLRENLTGNMVGDSVRHVFCSQCSLCQEYAEMTHRRSSDPERTHLQHSLHGPLDPPGGRLFLKDMEVRGTLGSGYSGTVKEGLWLGATTVALKSIRPDASARFEAEARILQSARHPNVVQFLGIYVDAGGTSFLVTEFLRLGSLDLLLRHSDEIVTPELRARIARDIAAGVAFLTQARILHRDIAARNVLLKEEDGVFVGKLGDFGMARVMDSTGAYVVPRDGAGNEALPYAWCAPEVFDERRFSSASDVFALGVTVWEVFNGGAHPWEDRDYVTVRECVQRGITLPMTGSLSPDIFANVVQPCASVSPSSRPSAYSICRFFAEYLTKTGQGASRRSQSFTTSTQSGPSEGEGLYVYSSKLWVQPDKTR
mmetsp:Transcript_19544/g.54969  ORF Transcript_19544/g.54969 Transcript_19544/m.54969 type:complete len:747 (+) Transcript_19544:174-2414(+)